MVRSKEHLKIRKAFSGEIFSRESHAHFTISLETSESSLKKKLHVVLLDNFQYFVLALLGMINLKRTVECSDFFTSQVNTRTENKAISFTTIKDECH